MVVVTKPLSQMQSFRICPAVVAVQWGNTKWVIFTMGSMANHTGSMVLKPPTQMLLKERWSCMRVVLYPIRRPFQNLLQQYGLSHGFQKIFYKTFRYNRPVNQTNTL